MRFYVLRKPRAGLSEADTEFYEVEPVNMGEAPRCEACGRLVGMLPLLPPYKVELETWGRSFGDVAFGPGESLLFSERFRDLFIGHGLTGLEGFDPVEVVNITSHNRLASGSPPYYHATVARSQAVIDQEKSEFEWSQKPTCMVCREGHDIRRWKRIVIAPDTWSGEDLFVPIGLFEWLASERFKRFCEENEITNAFLVPAEEYGHDFYPWEKRGPSGS
jgi:hypothetical protein